MAGSGRFIPALVSSLLLLLCLCCLSLVVDIGPEGELVEQRPKLLLLLCSWVNCLSAQSVLPSLSPKHSMESQSGACVLHSEEEAGLLARFAFHLQKGAWKESEMSKENLSLGMLVLLFG